jgi:hypothetical protein
VQNEPIAALNAGVNQWLKRIVDGAGCDLLEGATVVHFAAGNSLATHHLCFWPHFAGVPDLTCEFAADAEIRVKATAVYPWGARVELKRPSDILDETVVELRYKAIYAPRSAGAV